MQTPRIQLCCSLQEEILLHNEYKPVNQLPELNDMRNMINSILLTTESPLFRPPEWIISKFHQLRICSTGFE